MASWFSNISSAVAESSAAVLGDKLNGQLTGLKDKVQSKVNNIDPDLIKKLTLQSDDMVAERKQMEEEDTRKENVRDSLAEILPWETRDAEMEILVDECKEVILGLSSQDDTFTGPFVLPGGLPTAGEEVTAGAGGDEEGGAGDDDDDEDDEDRRAAKDLAAAEVSAEKLSKLQPLPTLLADFDLDTHVGLIQRLFEVDPKLVEMHSRLSSGGQRELMFWKNYFFHCAYTRYEAGLSIDEIWSNEPNKKTGPAVGTMSGAVEDAAEYDVVENASDEEVIFDSASSAASVESGSNKESLPDTDSGVAIDAQPSHAATAATTTTAQTSIPAGVLASPPSSPKKDAIASADVTAPLDSAVESGGTDYEFVAGAGGDDDDGSMDELEAEIAAALDD
eukprot:CAMPEP_0183710072 /NCGR_PEP_ID=MMETSP0737-20130205/5936_1 /TAXON_ID=385413 /ORGANISM="Thalassiosira miniscula, Strain CCMP1093" /LENGTH=391 /DNA_ID=CAMNT_0025938295 /DNA_START=63 /DNA_END=1238 /DNA_ORIENTATION=-